MGPVRVWARCEIGFAFDRPRFPPSLRPMSSLRDYEQHLREKPEAPFVPGPARFVGLVLCALALAAAEHWIRRQFPFPVLPFDRYLFAGIVLGWLLVASLIALGVHRSRRLRAQLLWLGCGVLLLAGEWAVAEWDWRPAARLQSAMKQLNFESADAQTMRTLEARRAAESRIDAQLKELRDSVSEATGQSAATLRGWVQWKSSLRPHERGRAESSLELLSLMGRGASAEAIYAQRERIALTIDRLNKSCQALMQAAENLPTEYRRAMLEAGVWEWRAERMKDEMERDRTRLGWQRIYHLESRQAECYREILKIVERLEARRQFGDRAPLEIANPRDIESWRAAIEVTAAEHARVLGELLQPSSANPVY